MMPSYGRPQGGMQGNRPSFPQQQARPQWGNPVRPASNWGQPNPPPQPQSYQQGPYQQGLPHSELGSPAPTSSVIMGTQPEPGMGAPPPPQHYGLPPGSEAGGMPPQAAPMMGVQPEPGMGGPPPPPQRYGLPPGNQNAPPMGGGMPSRFGGGMPMQGQNPGLMNRLRMRNPNASPMGAPPPMQDGSMRQQPQDLQMNF